MTNCNILLDGIDIKRNEPFILIPDYSVCRINDNNAVEVLVCLHNMTWSEITSTGWFLSKTMCRIDESEIEYFYLKNKGF